MTSEKVRPTSILHPKCVGCLLKIKPVDKMIEVFYKRQIGSHIKSLKIQFCSVKCVEEYTFFPDMLICFQCEKEFTHPHIPFVIDDKSNNGIGYVLCNSQCRLPMNNPEERMKFDGVNRCFSCGCTSSLKHCSKCFYALYCSTNCQKHHWGEHKLQCSKVDTKKTSNRSRFENQIKSHRLSQTDLQKLVDTLVVNSGCGSDISPSWYLGDLSNDIVQEGETH